MKRERSEEEEKELSEWVSLKGGNFNGIHGKRNDSVATPKDFYDFLNEIHQFDFDPCPFEKPAWDGLEIEWKDSNFVNPPYSEIRKWLKKGIQEWEKGRKSVFLITARINSKYWFDLIWPIAHVEFLEGGLIFGGYEKKFPFPLALVTFDPVKKPTERPLKRFKKQRFVEV